MKESSEVCDGCERPINECVGYGSCVPRLRSELALAVAVVEAARKLRKTDLPEIMTATEVGEMLMPVEESLTAFDAGRKP